MPVLIPIIKKMKLSDIDPAVYNPRDIDADSLRGLQDSLLRFGLLDVIVVNVAGGKKTIVSGHQRCKALIDAGTVFADVAVVEFDEVTEKIANISLNNPAIQGTWDVAKGLPQVDKIIASLPKPDLAGFNRLQAELKKEADRATRLARGTGPEADATDRTKPAVSESGVMYTMGRHKLYAGSWDSGIDTVMGAALAEACITSLPLNGEARIALVEDATARILAATKGACYLFVDPEEVGLFESAWSKGHGVLERWLLWVKDKTAFAKGDYQSQYEMILYGYRMGSQPHMPKVLSNVFEVPAVKEALAKPTVLVKALMENATKEGDVVLDPFASEGTTVVVAEMLGRTCFACETDLHRVDAIRKRWALSVHGPAADWKELTKVLS